METDIASKLATFVATFAGVPHESISQNTTLFGELGIDGDDAFDLISDLTREFSIDFSDFPFERHFGTEGFTPFAFVSWFLCAIRTGSPETRNGLTPIRICDLTYAAQTGKWPRHPDPVTHGPNA